MHLEAMLEILQQPEAASKNSLLSVGSRAVRRRHCVGGGAPVNFGWRGVGGQKFCFKSSRKNFVLSSKFSDDLF